MVGKNRSGEMYVFHGFPEASYSAVLSPSHDILSVHPALVHYRSVLWQGQGSGTFIIVLTLQNISKLKCFPAYKNKIA